ncbi:aldo/keto reductase [Streptomyces graminifolii]|uniref:aldo/keto reductase n=1 Tax=Streptomyces graminifolii TaxID=1266771 RepID=UPI0040580C3C
MILCRDEDLAVAERVHEIAGKRGLSAAQVALAWAIRNPAVTSPVVGGTAPAQLDSGWTRGSPGYIRPVLGLGLGLPCGRPGSTCGRSRDTHRSARSRLAHQRVLKPS